MAYKTLLTVATASNSLEPAISVASRLAVARDAHLDVLAVGIEHTSMPYYEMGAVAAAIQMANDHAQESARAIAHSARVALEASSPSLRYSVEPEITQLGGLTSMVAFHARFSDLVVQALPYASNRSSYEESVVEAALFEGQAPVLVLPESAGSADLVGARVVIAWKEGCEALNAVRKAMPFLLEAQSVNVVVIDPGSYGNERSQPGTMLCQMLARHGIRADISLLARTLPRTSDILARHVRDQNADLLVMGAYGHSRLREAILGGTTRNMLKMAEVPVVMAH